MKRTCCALAVLCMALLLPVMPAMSQPSMDAGKVWRVIYVEGGPFSDYQTIFYGMVQGLARQGFVQPETLPAADSLKDSRALWQWLTQHGTERMRFLQNGFYSAGWDQSRRESIKEEILNRIRTKGDVDMIFAFGTWAGQDFAGADISIPVIVSSATNAVDAKIIRSVDDSGRDNVWACTQPNRHYRQVRLFHDIFPFKKLGLVYEDSPSGRDSVALNELEHAAEDLHVELLRCTDEFDIPDENLAAERLLQCHQKLADAGADAVYVTYNIGMIAESIPQVLAPLIKARIPTFSQRGSSEVKHGVLLSISQASLMDEGVFSAYAVGGVLRGELPRSRSQRYESMISLAVNLHMAMLVGWNPALDILAAVDEFYQKM